MSRFRYALLMLIVVPFLLACAWDYDTIKMERQRFPSTLELITGKFLRHSPEFYQWRITDRLNRLKTEPENVALLDDLAVAYDKTGQHDKAIETALEIEKRFPKRYETAANLGTFYFHAGKLNDGIPHIEKALAINPDAHFGRERYQLFLVQYTIEQRKAGRENLPLASVEYGDTDRIPLKAWKSFNTFVQKYDQDLNSEADIQKAVAGIQGMMKFGNYRSPVLLEALGFLLTAKDYPKHDAKLLAARAFLKASYEVEHEQHKKAYRMLAIDALQMQATSRDSQTQITIEQVEADFKKELAEAEEWYGRLHESEKSWIRDGLDPEKEFDKLYTSEPEHSGMDAVDPMTFDQRIGLSIRVGSVAILLGVVVIAGIAVVLIIRTFRKQKSKSEM